MAETGALPRAAAGSAAPARRTLTRRSPAMRRAMPYLLVAPAVVYLLMITLYPGAFAIWQSFYIVRFNKMIWSGVGNYQMLFGDREFWAALGALLGVVLIDILPGVAIGVALSFILLIHTIDHPHIAVLGRSGDGARFADLEDDPDATAIPGVQEFITTAPANSWTPSAGMTASRCGTPRAVNRRRRIPIVTPARMSACGHVTVAPSQKARFQIVASPIRP